MKRQFRNRVFGLAAGTVAFGVISACGGAGGGGLDVADGGIRGTGSSVGPVSGFGSVFVNGVKFNTEDLNGFVLSNDGISSETELSEGMILRVEGEWQDNGQGVAESLEYDDTFRGLVADLTLSQNGEQVSFTIYGQELFATTQTVFRGKSIGALSNGDFVRVSAYRQSDGRYRASFIGQTIQNEADIELEVNLGSADVEVGLRQFKSNGYTITYDEIALTEGLSESDLEAGGFFEIEGELVAPSLINATKIDRDDFRRYQQSQSGDVEFTGTVQAGYISDSSDNRPGEFTLGGLTIRVTGETELDDGLTLDKLQPELLIQVEGRFIGDAVVEAEEIELRDADSKVEGVITPSSVSISSSRFNVGGVMVQVTPATILTRDDDEDIKFDQLPEESVVVEVEGIERGGPGDIYLEALKVEIDDETADNGEVREFELEGRVVELSPNAITVLGVSIETPPGVFENNSFNDIQARLNEGETAIVEIEYEYYKDENKFIADEVELEEDDDD